MIQLNPYISFKDNAREAMEFYQTIFGGKLDVSTFGEFHASADSSENNKVMHATLEGDNGIIFMASDTPNSMEFHVGASISMSLSGDDAEILGGYWEKLSERGMVIMPFEIAPWGDRFGMVTDKFGVTWMVNVTGVKA